MPATNPWTRRRPTSSPFALPHGIGGWFAGRLMLWTNRQQELIDLLTIDARHRVLEVGFGPGGLIRRLLATPASRIDGVEPSAQMLRLVSRRHRRDIATGRLELRSGTAADTGFGDGEFDRVVAVNNVAIWPDLSTGLDELRRITRPGGRLVIAWHGGRRPSAIARANMLSDAQATRVTRAMRERFTVVDRRELPTLTTWTAVR